MSFSLRRLNHLSNTLAHFDSPFRQFSWAFEPVVVRRENARLTAGDDAYQLSVELPGVRPENLSVSVLEGVLSLDFTRDSRVSSKAENEKPLTEQRRYAVPDDVNVESVSASLGHGVLTLSLPRRAKAQPKNIQVTVAPQA
jgi:HSP20 family molecular chaperone IbpA